MPQTRRPGKRLIGGMVGLAAVVAYLVGNRILSTEVGRHISGDAHCILRNQGSRVGDYTSYMWGALGVIGLVVVLILVRTGYRHEWTGFGKHVYRKSDEQEEIQPQKTLWDWLALLVVPVVLAVGGFWFTVQQDARQQALEEQRAQDAALQAYLDKMGALLLDKGLRSSGEDDEVRMVARARTSSVISRLDSTKNQVVTRFLQDADLVGKESSVKLLKGANLNGADLKGVDLTGADLTDASFIEADLTAAQLQDANLRGASFWDADLYLAQLDGAILSSGPLNFSSSFLGADLCSANLKGTKGVSEVILEQQTTYLRGATMPNGSEHEW
jgi:hypothetical protein